MLLAIVLIFSLVPATSFAASATSAEKTDDGTIEITSKAKTASYKITWNANGGKIGTKKTIATSVKKGSKLAKVAKSPKRGGYTFKGWYTKKSGGTKISKNIKPKKSVTYYARWTKKISKRVLNGEEKKLVGEWESTWDGSSVYKFGADGSYFQIARIRFGFQNYDAGFKGYYSVKNGMMTLRYQYFNDYVGKGFTAPEIVWSDWETSSNSLKLFTEDGKQKMTYDGINYRKVS